MSYDGQHHVSNSEGAVYKLMSTGQSIGRTTQQMRCASEPPASDLQGLSRCMPDRGAGPRNEIASGMCKLDGLSQAHVKKCLALENMLRVHASAKFLLYVNAILLEILRAARQGYNFKVPLSTAAASVPRWPLSLAISTGRVQPKAVSVSVGWGEAGGASWGVGAGMRVAPTRI